MRNGIIQTKRIWNWCCVACLALCQATAHAQQLQTFTDKSSILIGEQVQVKIKASFPAGTFRVNWFSLPDSIPHFELVQKGSLDSSSENGNTILQQSLTLTSFDSGRWNLPALPVVFDPVKDDTTLRLFTDAVAIDVSYSPSDTTNQLRDIKPIIPVSIRDYTWYYIAGGILLLLLILFFVYRYWKKQPINKPLKPATNLTAFQEAMQALEHLAKQDLSDPVAVKNYHTSLATIFKHYLGRKQQHNLLTRTTSDILVRINKTGVRATELSALATALRCTDAVKFAKYLPEHEESQDCREMIKSTIEYLESQASNSKPLT